MTQTVVFVHGAWVTPLCWEYFIGYYENKGYTCLAPAWPHKANPVAELNRNPPAGLARLGVREIVDHYAGVINALKEPPFLIGHSFGGLFVQMLLDRGLGAAGVAIDSAPPRGVLPFFYPSTLKSNLWILASPGAWRKVIRQSFKEFQYAFVNALPEHEQRKVYDRYVVPETGRIFFQSAFALFNDATRVNFSNNKRAPLLLIAGSSDNNVTAAMNAVNYRRYKKSTALTDFKEFPGRCHWIIAQEGWEEVAEYAASWVSRIGKA